MEEELKEPSDIEEKKSERIIEYVKEERKPDIDFLFDISKEVKQFYETPVIFLTKKDYSDVVFNTLCTLRRGLDTDSKQQIMDTIVDFHLQWLYAVNELENFKKMIPDIPREDIYQAISYTIDAIVARLKYYQIYMDKNRKQLSNLDQTILQTELEIVEEMHADVSQALTEKLKCFRNFAGEQEFILKVKEEADELLSWLDKINDSLATQISKYVSFHVPHLSADLTKTLKEIVDELQTSRSPSAQKLITELKIKGEEIGSMIRCTAGHFLEINKVIEKINVLDDRIKRLEMEPSSAAVMALTRKKQYLERRLSSLEKLKTTIRNLQESELEEEEKEEEEGHEETICICEDFFKLRIFNHSLPLEEREKLVTKLCSLWDVAIFGEKGQKSIISILSAAEMKEEFTDELGTYYIDEHSRKVYKLPETDGLFQLNEQNELVPIADDADHVYFYDECGRYFIDAKTRQRVYKAHENASEYMMDSSGALLKVKEERDGVVYYYDNYGRYYINDEGVHIYRDPDTVSEYENDGLGNLVRIQSHTDRFMPCPQDENVTEDFNYLKLNVGTALRVCISECILKQPADPIKFLSSRLIKYRENIELQERRARERDELNAEREIYAAEARAAAERAALEAMLLTQGGSEASFDSNLVHYTSMHPDNSITSQK